MAEATPADQRFEDQRFEDQRFEDHRFEDHRFEDQRFEDRRADIFFPPRKFVRRRKDALPDGANPLPIG